MPEGGRIDGAHQKAESDAAAAKASAPDAAPDHLCHRGRTRPGAWRHAPHDPQRHSGDQQGYRSVSGGDRLGTEQRLPLHGPGPGADPQPQPDGTGTADPDGAGALSCLPALPCRRTAEPVRSGRRDVYQPHDAGAGPAEPEKQLLPRGTLSGAPLAAQ